MLSEFQNKAFDNGFIPSIEYYKELLEEDLLKKYWIKNKENIIKYAEKYPNNEVYTLNYVAKYSDDFGLLKKELDKLLN